MSTESNDSERLMVFCGRYIDLHQRIPMSGYSAHLEYVQILWEPLLKTSVWVDPHNEHPDPDHDVVADITKDLKRGTLERPTALRRLDPDSKRFTHIVLAACPTQILTIGSVLDPVHKHVVKSGRVFNDVVFTNAWSELRPGGVLLVAFPRAITGAPRCTMSPYDRRVRPECLEPKVKEAIDRNVRSKLTPRIKAMFDVHQNVNNALFQPFNSPSCYISGKKSCPGPGDVNPITVAVAGAHAAAAQNLGGQSVSARGHGSRNGRLQIFDDTQ